MTISTTTRTKQYNGNASTTVFAYDFNIQAEAEIEVYLGTPVGAPTSWALQTITTHYTVSNAGVAGGGNVTFGSAPPSGTGNVFIRRVTPKTQATDYVENDSFPSSAHENALDKLTQVTQDMQEEIDRCFKLGTIVPDVGTTEASSVVAERKNKLFAFDDDGDFSVTSEIGTVKGNWAASTAYVLRDIVKDTNNNNIYICITAHTSSGSVPISSNTDVAKWFLLVDAASATTSQSAAASSATAAASSATAAAASASTATAKAVLTASDAVDTAADLVETAADVVLAEAAKVTAVAATGASAFKYTFDNSTTMADPGSAGEIRYNHGTVGSVTALAIRATSADTGNPDISPFIASWDDGDNSTHEGYITIRKSGTPATYAVFSLTGAVVDNTAWLQLPVTHVSSNGSWSNADTLYISFTRSGQKGDTGSTGAIGPSAGLDMIYESTTTDTDQGAGKIFFNHGTLSSASVLYMDDVDSNAASINSYIDSWDDSTTTALRGTVTVTKQSDAAVFAIYNVTGAVTSASTYSKIPVSYVTGAGSFTDADTCTVHFTRTGNTGSAGSSTPSDATFRIQDNSDNTKQIAFEASSIGSGVTRTITMPNSDVTLVAGALANVSEDGSPQLGASLDILAHNITSSTTIMNPSISSTGKALVLGF